MHIGHARGAVYGDALAKLLKKCGYKVTKEYYINDAGSQIDDLTKTVILRYKEALTGEKVTIPEGLYPGEYLIDIGSKIFNQFGDKLLKMDETACHELVKKIAVDEMMLMIRQDLKDLDIEHDVFFSEQSLHDSGKIAEVIKILADMGLIYEGQLPPPKGKEDVNWENRVQLLFKSTAFGDEQDRPVQKSDGAWSYLAADLAYAKDKIDRGFDNLIYVLGADHSGYVKRIKAVVNALGQSRVKCDVKICQIVNFVENNVPIKMSKRKGSFTTVKDVVNEVGKDIIRFIMLTRKNDAPLDFDLEKVKEQSKDNPVFYVQYAHVRTISILSNGKECTPDAYAKFIAREFDLSLLSSEEEIQLIKLLASWPKVLEGAAVYFEPHRIAFYLLNVAAKFHSLWNLGKENNDYRFVVEDNIELTSSRLALVQSTQQIIVRGFEIIGITPMDKM
jgi:arginyl-tRNA synthetase